MAKFLFLYRMSTDAMPAKPPSPEEMQQVMAAWHAWMAKFKKSGQLVDGGDGLKPAGKVIRPDKTVTDGPFTEAKEVLGGFSILQAATIEEALAIAMECPGAGLPGSSIEIREFAGYS